MEYSYDCPVLIFGVTGPKTAAVVFYGIFRFLFISKLGIFNVECPGLFAAQIHILQPFGPAAGRL